MVAHLQHGVPVAELVRMSGARPIAELVHMFDELAPSPSPAGFEETSGFVPYAVTPWDEGYWVPATVTGNG
jgi:hypothetical protein